MSDRTSAAIFGYVFELLAENPSEEHKAIALKLYNFYVAQDYDFSPREMYAGEACLNLGIAKLRVDKTDITDKGILVFPGETGFE